MGFQWLLHIVLLPPCLPSHEILLSIIISIPFVHEGILEVSKAIRHEDEALADRDAPLHAVCLAHNDKLGWNKFPLFVV